MNYLTQIDSIAEALGNNVITGITDLSNNLRRELIIPNGNKPSTSSGATPRNKFNLENIENELPPEFLEGIETILLTEKIENGIRARVARSVEDFPGQIVGGTITVETFVKNILGDLEKRIPELRPGRKKAPAERQKRNEEIKAQTLLLGFTKVIKGLSEAGRKKDALNLLRYIGILSPITYELLHKLGVYKFMDGPPNALLENIIGPYKNGPGNDIPIIEGKEVVDLGAGTGNDVASMLSKFGALKVTAVDSSHTAIQKIRSRIKKLGLPTDSLETVEMDMQAFLAMKAGSDERFDTVYTHSTWHYADNKLFLEYLTNTRRMLEMGGHLALGIKLPGAVFDGQGIKLVERSIRTPHGEGVKKGYLNPDGIIRLFRNIPYLAMLIDRSAKEGPQDDKFERRQIGSTTIEGYEVPGETQDIGFLIFKKVPTKKEI